MGIEQEKGDYVGYRVQTDEGTGIQLVGPLSRPDAIKLATEITNSYNTAAIRIFSKNQGGAILAMIEAFIRRDKLKEKNILP